MISFSFEAHQIFRIKKTLRKPTAKAQGYRKNIENRFVIEKKE
jgi:hypothetical protein